MENTCPEHFIADSHCDTLRLTNSEGYNFTLHNDCAHIDLPRLRAGKVNLMFFAVCTAPYCQPGSYLYNSMIYIRNYHRLLNQNREQLLALENSDDLEPNKQNNRIYCLLSLEGAEPLEDCPDNLEIFFRLGVRCVSLTWNSRNMFADGVGENAAGSGLTSLGRRLLERMSALGIILDLAHLSPRCFDEALDQSARPPLVSHANSHKMCNHPRNLTDEQVKAVASKGGVIGLSFNAPFVSGNKTATLSQLADHYVHLAEVAGTSHLAIGSDFDGTEYPVEQLSDASCYGNLLMSLYDRGFSPADIDLIAGGNLRRIIKANLK